MSKFSSIQGKAAHDAAVSGNPVLVAGRAMLTVPTAVADGDVTYLGMDKHQRGVFVHNAPPDKWLSGHSGQIADTATTQVIAAQGAGVKIYITDIMVTNGDAAVGTLVTIQDDAGSPVKLWEGYASKLGGGWAMHFETPLAATANQDVDAVCGTTSAEVYVSISGFAAP